MTPVDAFLRSVRTAFRPADDGSEWIWAGVAICVLLAILLGRIRARHQRARAAKGTFARLLADRKIPAADGRAIARLAERIGVAPVLVATHVDVFERATAAALAGHAPTLGPAGTPTAAPPDSSPEDVFAGVGRLRRALGFHMLAEHFPLLTTRELGPGVRAELAGTAAQVNEVTEGWFALETGSERLFGPVSVGSRVTVQFTRGHEARYAAHCPVLSTEPARAPRRMVLGHDEHPERIQLRAAVRVSARGTVELRPRTGAEEPIAQGSLIDVSVGGLAMQTSTKVAVGAALHASIDWDGVRFPELPAWVLECKARPRDNYHVRLEFRGLPQNEESRLSAEVARRSARVPEGTGGERG